MYRLLAAICLTGVTGLLLVGGCTPESENTWSESLDFSAGDPRLNEMSGTYMIQNDIDDRFTTLTIFQTGGTLQGHDNMRRSWRGTIVMTPFPPGSNIVYKGTQLQLQTSDGPEGQVVITANAVIYQPVPDACFKAIDGVFYSGEKSGSIFGVGQAVPCELDE